jgi:hypothetical protein
MNQKPITSATGSPPRVMLLLLATIALLVGCGVSAGESFETIAPQEIPFGLDQPLSTAASTTTTTEPPEGPDGVTPTTSPVQTEPVNVYFVLGLDRLQRLTVQFASPVELLQVLALLADGPPSEQSIGLRSAVRAGLVVDLFSERGVAQVDLQGSVLNQLAPRDQRLAIAQIVLSVLGSARGVGQVSFTIDGEPAEIGIPPDYTLSRPGQPLAFADFESLLSGRPGETLPPIDPDLSTGSETGSESDTESDESGSGASSD